MHRVASHTGQECFKILSVRISAFKEEPLFPVVINALSVSLLTGRWEKKGETRASEQVSFERMTPNAVGFEPDGESLPPKDSNIIIMLCIIAMST